MNAIKTAEKKLQATIFVKFLEAGDTNNAAAWSEEKEFGKFEWDLVREIIEENKKS